MHRTYGPADDCATLRAARTDQTWSQRPWTDGSGRRPEASCRPPTRHRLAGHTTPGVRVDTRRCPNRTTLSSTLMALRNHAWAYWTTCTVTVSRGTTSVAITRSRLCVKTATSCSTTWPPLTRVSSFRLPSSLATLSPPPPFYVRRHLISIIFHHTPISYTNIHIIKSSNQLHSTELTPTTL